jgi:hypothetical protein
MRASYGRIRIRVHLAAFLAMVRIHIPHYATLAASYTESLKLQPHGNCNDTRAPHANFTRAFRTYVET